MIVNSKIHRALCGAVTAAIMTAIISFTLTAVNSGLHAFQLSNWLARMRLIAFSLVFAISFLLPAFVNKHVSKIVRIKE